MKIYEIVAHTIDEAKYEKQVGMEETFLFMKLATPEQKILFKQLLKDKEIQKAWKLISLVTGKTFIGAGMFGND